jgi:CysZ protein
MIARAILLSVRQLVDPQTLRLLLLTIAITLAIFAALGTALWWLLDAWVIPRWFPAGNGDFAALAAAAIGLILLWFLFRAVAMLVIGLFTDGIVASVEEDHYPAKASAARTVSLATGLRLGLTSALRAIGWNLVAAPAYIALLVTGVGTLALALLVNTILLGRDFETMVAARHPGAPAMPRSNRWTLGVVSAAAFLVPGLNLLAPVFGAALAVHLFHAPRKPLP